jgi:DNA-binding NtrC family response regulator
VLHSIVYEPGGNLVILHISRDQSLLEKTSVALEQHGYTVVSALDLRQVTMACTDYRIETVILCHSIPAPERKLVVRMIRESCNPIPPIIGIGRTRLDEVHEAEVVISVQELPLGIFLALGHLLSTSKQSTSSQAD